MRVALDAHTTGRTPARHTGSERASLDGVHDIQGTKGGTPTSLAATVMSAQPRRPGRSLMLQSWQIDTSRRMCCVSLSEPCRGTEPARDLLGVGWPDIRVCVRQCAYGGIES